jgi:hypothetical protein
MNHTKLCSKIGMVCAIILLMTIQPVAAVTATLSATQKTALENGVIFHQGPKPLTPIFYTTVYEMTSNELGDCYHIIGTIQIFVEDYYTQDEYFYSMLSVMLRNKSSGDQAAFELVYGVIEQGRNGDPNGLSSDVLYHTISIDILFKDQLQTNLSMGVSQFHLTVQSITDKGSHVDQNIRTQTIELIYTFDAMLFDRSNIYVAPPTTRTTTTSARPTMNTITNTTTNTTSTSSSGDDLSSILETNSIAGYSLPLLVGGILVGLLVMRKRLIQVTPQND